jgi:hypothetical protein
MRDFFDILNFEKHMHEVKFAMAQFNKFAHWVQIEWTKNHIWRYMEFKVNEMGIALSSCQKEYHGKDNGYYW